MKTVSRLARRMLDHERLVGGGSTSPRAARRRSASRWVRPCRGREAGAGSAVRQVARASATVGVDHPAVAHVHAPAQAGVGAQRAVHALVGEPRHVGQRRVAERARGRHRARRPACWPRSSAGRRRPRTPGPSGSWGGWSRCIRPDRRRRPRPPTRVASCRAPRGGPGAAPGRRAAAPRPPRGRRSAAAPRSRAGSSGAASRGRPAAAPARAAGRGSCRARRRGPASPPPPPRRWCPRCRPPGSRTEPGATPATPPSSTPRPPSGRSR